jgi:acetyltransferase-like isoleucine patch superfamily enzyme
MLTLTQFFIKSFRPAFNGFLTRFLYFGDRVKIGKGFRTDSVPRIIVDKNCVVTLGDHVEFKRNIEIRSHGTSSITIGNNTRIDRGVRILAANHAHIRIEQFARIGLYSVLNGGDSITVGAKGLISGFVYLQTSMHGFNSKAQSIQEQGYTHAPIHLEEDTWLGTHVVVMPGVTIGKGGVVGSNAVVNKNVSAYQVVAGVPAKPINDRE